MTDAEKEYAEARVAYDQAMERLRRAKAALPDLKAERRAERKAAYDRETAEYDARMERVKTIFRLFVNGSEVDALAAEFGETPGAIKRIIREGQREF